MADTQKQLEDKEKQCQDGEASHESEEKARQQEVIGIEEAMKILNEDSALDLFRKTLKDGDAVSFVQTSMLVSMQTSKFGKLVGHCERLIQSLHHEQTTEDKERDGCTADLSSNELTVKDAVNAEALVVQQEEEKKTDVCLDALGPWGSLSYHGTVDILRVRD